MKKTLLFLLPFLTILSLTATAQGDPDTLTLHSFTYDGKQYDIVMNMHDWTTAAQVAVLKGGHLAHIESQAEADSVYNEIINGAMITSNYTVVNDGGGIAYVWIGGTDQATEGTWLWDGDFDNQGMIFWMGEGAAGMGGGYPIGGAFINWGGAGSGTPNEPDDYNANQDACAIALAGWPAGVGSLGSAGEWNDIAITNQLYYVIEYENTTGLPDGISTETMAWCDNEENMIHITTPGGDFGIAELWSAEGRLLLRFELQGESCSISTTLLPSGIYLLRTMSGNRLDTFKLPVH